MTQTIKILFQILICIVVCFILIGLALIIIDEIRYAINLREELKNNKASCYFEKGLFNIPIAKICNYSVGNFTEYPLLK